jgi:hypothetical protein
MSVQVSQLNRAVSMASVEVITTVRHFTATDLFALPGGSNVVDGTYTPFTREVDTGWWGSELSDAAGYLPNPAVLTVTERMSAYRFILSGIRDNFPVDFTLSIYKDRVLQKELEIKGNTEETYEVTFDRAYDIDTYVLTITRISLGKDVLKVSEATFGNHLASLMKQHDRHIYGRVEVAYNNFMKDTTVEVNDGAHGSLTDSVTNNSHTASAKFFKLYDNSLDGSYKLIGQESEAGWWPKTMPDANGVYTVPYTFRMSFSQRSLYSFYLYSDAIYNDYPVDFDVRFIGPSGTIRTIEVRNHNSAEYYLADTIEDITNIEIDILKTNNSGRPAVIHAVPIESVVAYYGRDLIDISLLEELTYEDSIEKLGGVSANELVVNFSNEDKSFYFNNTASPIAKYLKKNKRVKAWLGVEIPNTEEILWSALGTFWTYDWNVPVGSLTAKCTAFDTIGLLGTRPFTNHVVYKDKSIGALIDIVLTSARNELPFIKWRVDPDLYDITIPFAWFANSNYRDALNKIASCDLLNIYCDRDGVIAAVKKMEGFESPNDVWSDSTNVIDKNYPTLYTSPPNYINVAISKVTIERTNIVKVDNINEYVVAGEVRTYTFKNPMYNGYGVGMDTTAEYTLEVFSCGMNVNFITSGLLRSIEVDANVIIIDNSSSILLRNEEAIIEDGIIECNIKSDFIQTVEHASRIARHLYDKSALSIYDAEVEYRGDISLTLNDIIHLSEGIAPINLYYIKRHELHWNGSLSGSARFNT